MNEIFECLNRLIVISILDSNEYEELTSVTKNLFKELEYKDTNKFIKVLNLIDVLCVDLLNEKIDVIIPKVDNIREYILYLIRYDSFHKKLAIEIPHKNNDDLLNFTIVRYMVFQIVKNYEYIKFIQIMINNM